MYYVEKMTYSISTTFIGMTYATSIPTTVLGMLVEPLQAWLMPLAFPQLLWEQTFLQSLWERYTLTNLANKEGNLKNENDLKNKDDLKK